MNDWLRSQGIRHIGLDSDGNISELIPVWIDAGLTHLLPFEVQSGMDVLEVRKKYGKSLAMIGGIDKRVLKHGTAAIHRFNRLANMIEADRPDENYLCLVAARDNLFPDMDYRIFQRRPWLADNGDEA